jgi:ribose transport system substrate-binding protein
MPNPPTDRSQSRLRARAARLKATAAAVAAVAVLSLFGAGCGGSSTSASSAGATSPGSAPGKKLHLAYFSFAVQNSYDAPMLAAAQKAAAAANAQLTVFDANNNAQTQYSQVQDAVATGSYNGVLIQPIDGAGLVPLVKQAISKHVQVVVFSQVLGPNLQISAPQVPGVAASIVYVDYARGVREGNLAEQACASLKTSACSVGYMYDVKASGFDQGVRAGFDSVVARDPKIKVAAEGQALFTANGGLQAAQAMLQAHPEINIMVGSDQGMEGATSAIRSTGRKVLIIGLGGSVAGLNHVKDGTWFGDVVAQPATEGKVAVEDVVKAITNGQHSGGVTVEARLPGDGIATQNNVSDFTGEWAG